MAQVSPYNKKVIPNFNFKINSSTETMHICYKSSPAELFIFFEAAILTIPEGNLYSHL